MVRGEEGRMGAKEDIERQKVSSLARRAEMKGMRVGRREHELDRGDERLLVLSGKESLVTKDEIEIKEIGECRRKKKRTQERGMQMRRDIRGKR